MTAMRAYAMQVAWEQVAYWQTFMSAADAAEIVGMGHARWPGVARRLAEMWLALKAQEFIRYARDAA